MKKRALSLLLVLIILLAAAACGQQGTTDQGTTNQDTGSATTNQDAGSADQDTAQDSGSGDISLSWYGTWRNPENSPVVEEIARRTGVMIDFSFNTGAGDATEGLAVMMAGGDMPDIVTFASNFGDIQGRLLNANVATPLDDLVHEYGQNIVRNAASALAISKMARTDDSNNLFFIPMANGGTTFHSWRADDAWYMRWDLYSQLGYPQMDTYDDLLDVMEMMLELEPVNKDGRPNYGFGMFLGEGWGNLIVDKPIYFFEGIYSPGQYAIQADIRTDRISSRLTDPNSFFIEGLRIWNEAYRRGLLDPESATMDFDQVAVKGTEGRYLAAPASWCFGNPDAQFAADGTPEKGLVPMLVRPAPDGVMYLGDLYDSGSHDSTFISTSCQNSERAMQFIDYFFSEDGSILLAYGIQGEHWELVDNHIKRTDAVIDAMATDPDFSTNTGISALQIFLEPNENLIHPDGYPLNPLHRDSYLATLTEPQRSYMDHYGFTVYTEMFTNVATNDNYNYSGSIMYSMALDPTSDLGAKEGDLTAYVETTYARLIFQETAADFESEVQAFIDRCIAIGADEIVAEYDRMYEELKVEFASYLAGMN